MNSNRKINLGVLLALSALMLLAVYTLPALNHKLEKENTKLEETTTKNYQPIQINIFKLL